MEQKTERYRTLNQNGEKCCNKNTQRNRRNGTHTQIYTV